MTTEHEAIELRRRARNAELRQNLLIGLLVLNFVAQTIIGGLDVKTSAEQNRLQDTRNQVWKRIADAQEPRSLTTGGVAVDEHPSTVTVRQHHDAPPAAMVDDMRQVLKALKE